MQDFSTMSKRELVRICEELAVDRPHKAERVARRTKGQERNRHLAALKRDLIKARKRLYAASAAPSLDKVKGSALSRRAAAARDVRRIESHMARLYHQIKVEENIT